jgi:oxygen-independent coproporphyrinogen-3 oxidase
MYGIPEQTEESFKKSLELVASLSPEHISSYGLTVEEGTYFFAHRDELDIADGDGQARMYEILGEYLSSRGYEKYEISNFARKGRESRHNTRYWRRMDYLGFGVAAHSCFENVRFGNSIDIDAFLRGEDICEERYELDFEERRREYIMLGLRLAEGIDKEKYRKAFGGCFPSVEKFINGGFMREQNGRVAFTEKGFLVSNAILSELI